MRKTQIIILLALFVAACSPVERRPDKSPGEMSSKGVVEVVARGLKLHAPSEITSGWTTFEFRNESSMIHFALIERLPEGHDIETQQEEIAPVFQQGMDLLAVGKVEAAMAKFGELPAWFGDVVFIGGPGLTSPDQTSRTTVYLEPGSYLMECYVKTGGVFHSYNPDPSLYGMVHGFTVTHEASGAAEPTSDLQLSISSTGGIEMSGTPTAGEQTIAIHFADQKVHENFVGHDVHLVRLADGLDLGNLEQWMDWSRPAGLQTPAPAQFLGGLNELPANSRGYLTVSFATGEYAWISEVPGSREKGMLKIFRVD